MSLLSRHRFPSGGESRQVERSGSMTSHSTGPSTNGGLAGGRWVDRSSARNSESWTNNMGKYGNIMNMLYGNMLEYHA